MGVLPLHHETLPEQLTALEGGCHGVDPCGKRGYVQFDPSNLPKGEAQDRVAQHVGDHQTLNLRL